MQCPVCDERLREVEKYGVMVDICPSCKGVWLDRGELEKIARLEEREDRPGHDDEWDGRRSDHREGSDRDRGYQREGQSRTPKKRSFLSDLMEGFGD